MSEREKMISIFTPTYNRKELLKKLKKSLDAQTSFDFEWIIVDDGSKDGTTELLKEWESKVSNYKIVIAKQKNQGKHIAFNTGVKLASTEWFFCVDSDDELTSNAVSILNKSIKSIPKGCSGVVFPRKMKGVNDSDAWSKIDGKLVDIIDLHSLYHVLESAIVIKTSLLKKYPFPKFGAEKFLTEGWLYVKLVKEGPFLVVNNPIYISAYQMDGLTKKLWKLWKNNPIGVTESLRETYKCVGKYPLKRRVIERAKTTINLESLWIALGRNALKKCPSMLYALVLYLPSIYFYRKRYRNL